MKCNIRARHFERSEKSFQTYMKQYVYMKKFYILSISFLLYGIVAFGAEDRIIELANTPQDWDNVSFAISYAHGNSVYNLRSFEICSPGKIFDIVGSPTGNSFLTLSVRGKGKIVNLYSYIDGVNIHNFKLSAEPTAICFAPNAKYLGIADKSNSVNIYDIRTYNVQYSISTSFAPQQICISGNNYFVAAYNGDRVYVWNMETGKERKIIEVGEFVNKVCFSNDNTKLGILGETGKLYLYDTKTFILTTTYDGLGDAVDFAFHPEGKYVAVVTGTSAITIVDMKNPTNRDKIMVDGSGISHIGYATAKNVPYLVYNANQRIVFHPIDNLTPDYEKLIMDEVEEKMELWMKQMPGETFEDYHLRVNDETRMAQYANFENEIATAMAGDQIGLATVSLGNYNQEKSMLEVSFDNMPSIYLDVPQEDVAEFKNPDQLSFDNSVYGVTHDDKFELIYTEVTNTGTGKKYVFDNLSKQSLEYMAANDNFVPLDLIQQSSMEEIKLQEIRQEVVNSATEENLISEHTHIDVKTKVEASTDANGDKIMNYMVDFDYNVEEEFSFKEDFPAGKYDISESKAAVAMMQIIRKAFQNEFAQYIKKGKKVKLVVTGSADAAPIRNKLPYKEEYGAQNDAIVTCNGQLKTLTVTAKTGVTTNEQLAFLRALSVHNYAETDLTELMQMRREYDYILNVSNERGAEYRRIGIRFIFIDAFDYDK